jgi:hypothetical protein
MYFYIICQVKALLRNLIFPARKRLRSARYGAAISLICAFVLGSAIYAKRTLRCQ